MTERQFSYEPSGVLFTETCKKTTTTKMASYSYSSFTPVPFARNAHTESHSTGIGIDNVGPPSYLLCLFCSQFCLYTSVPLTKSSTLRACHQKKMLSTVQMQDLLPEERKKTFLFLRDNAGLRAAESILKFKIDNAVTRGIVHSVSV